MRDAEKMGRVVKRPRKRALAERGSEDEDKEATRGKECGLSGRER